MKRINSRAIAIASAALFIAPLVSLGATTTPTYADAASPTRILTCTQKLASKPATYTLSCADANAGWTGMTWSAWGASTATGRGLLRQNNCSPNCVSGKFLDYRATVTLSKVITTKKYGALFSQATFHYSVGGKSKTEVFGLAD
jgi:hypothetical protein